MVPCMACILDELWNSYMLYYSTYVIAYQAFTMHTFIILFLLNVETHIAYYHNPFPAYQSRVKKPLTFSTSPARTCAPSFTL